MKFYIKSRTSIPSGGLLVAQEYFFSDSGICRDDELLSHQGKEQGKPSEMYEAGALASNSVCARFKCDAQLQQGA